MRYRLLVLDIDGTLVNSNKKLTRQTRQGIEKAQQAGVTVALASGRPAYGIFPLAKELNLQKNGGYIISFNGGQIFDCRTQSMLHQKTLPLQMPALLYQMARENNVAILTYQDHYLITENEDNVFVKEEAAINKMPIRKIDSFCDYVKFPVAKCLMMDHPAHLEEVEQLVKQKFGDSLNVFRSAPFFLEVMPQGIEKAAALNILGEKTGIRQEEMIACGDGHNDISMISYAGLGVAMENAQPAVKRAADIITKSNDEDGVAHVIEKFILAYAAN